MKADLHTHSTVSDGSDAIEALILAAKRRGLEAVAITDHDTLSHARQILPDPGIRVICGIEISASY